MATRTADPWTDTDVIDARAPRFNQAVVGTVSAVAVLTGWWWLLALLAVQLLAGLTLGRRWCLPCVLYFRVVQPRFGEGTVEDARPPRFANLVGAGLLGGASLAYLAGLRPLGAALGGVVAALALLAAATGLCVGCELYRLLARARGVRPGGVAAVDLVELGALEGSGEPGTGAPAGRGSGEPGTDAPEGGGDGEVLVQFTHPLCGDCRELEARLRADARPLLTVDVSRRPEFARRYHVAVVPAAFRVAGDGTVLERLA